VDLERETVNRLDAMGFNFSPYLNNVYPIPVEPISEETEEEEEGEVV